MNTKSTISPKKKSVHILICIALALSLMLSACGSSAPKDAAAEGAAPQDAADSAERPVGDEAYDTDTDTGYELPAAEAEPEALMPAPSPQQDYKEDSVQSESYLTINENRAKSVESESMVTLSLKVDTASYTNVARYLQSGNLPPADAVRTEELLNYFSYERKMAFGDDPFSVYTELGPSPFDPDKHIAFIRVKTREIDKESLPHSNLTFLIDTSGSMDSYDKLPLLKEAFSLLVDTLDEDDKVSIVTYAGSSGIVLDSVSGENKSAILNAINNLSAEGSTAGANGILTAYSLAEKNFVPDGNNRVILATDGDFNVGPSSIEELETHIGEKRGNGVYLSILGFGSGNIRDDVMETLSKHGNGNYSYINSSGTAKKVLVDELGSNLFTVADDVKAQLEFNPETVRGYRLIGYENRRMNNEDFDDDTKDAGEIGAGTDVVILFELELQGSAANSTPEGMKYGRSAESSETSAAPTEFSDELFEVRIRYKDPGETESKLVVTPVTFDDIAGKNSTDFQFACSVAAFGHLLRGSEYAAELDLDTVTQMAKASVGTDAEGYRLEHLVLLQQCKGII